MSKEMFKELYNLIQEYKGYKEGKTIPISIISDFYTRWSTGYYQELSKNEDEQKIYEKAVDAFGREVQLVIVMEELSELIKECSKFYRNHLIHDRMLSEIVDVEIMIGQLKHMCLISYPANLMKKKFKEIKEEKLERLKKRINKRLKLTGG